MVLWLSTDSRLQQQGSSIEATTSVSIELGVCLLQPAVATALALASLLLVVGT